MRAATCKSDKIHQSVQKDFDPQEYLREAKNFRINCKPKKKIFFEL